MSFLFWSVLLSMMTYQIILLKISCCHKISRKKQSDMVDHHRLTIKKKGIDSSHPSSINETSFDTHLINQQKSKKNQNPLTVRKNRQLNPKSQSFSRSYGSNLPTSLIYIVLSTRGLLPWRPDAVKSTSEPESTYFSVPRFSIKQTKKPDIPDGGILFQSSYPITNWCIYRAWIRRDCKIEKRTLPGILFVVSQLTKLPSCCSGHQARNFDLFPFRGRVETLVTWKFFRRPSHLHLIKQSYPTN